MVPDVSQLRADLDALAQDLDAMADSLDPAFDFWRDRVNQVIDEVVGPRDALAIRFNGLQWTSGVSATRRRLDSYGGPSSLSTKTADASAFTFAKQAVHGILRTLTWKLDRGEYRAGALQVGGVTLDGASIEPDLWAHVRRLVEIGEWEKVPREAAVFVEDRLREWTRISGEQGRGSTEVFKAAVSDSGFRLGSTSSETQGWQQIFAGFALAIRNNAGHKLLDRNEMRRYAVAVLGTASLLLGQIRHQHGDPPQLPPGR